MIDFVKEQKDLYQPKAEPVIVEVPRMQFLMIDGQGAPDPDEGNQKDKNEFQQALAVLYGLAYGIKMSEKKGKQPEGYENFKVPPLEALWWMADGSAFDVANPAQWRWTAMMRLPEFVTGEVVKQFAEELTQKKKSDAFKTARLEEYEEGLSVQLMHIGPYNAEAPNIARMHEFAIAQGYEPHGKHHEIYYGDPRRSAPEKLRTVLRQPLRLVAGA